LLLPCLSWWKGLNHNASYESSHVSRNYYHEPSNPCSECGFKNSEVSFGGEIQEKGTTHKLLLTSTDDLDRQIIKSDSATIAIPCMQLEIPRSTQKGSITTIEGMLKTAAGNLERDQPERLKIGDIDNFHRCRQVISDLNRLAGSPMPDIDDDDSDEEETKKPTWESFEIILDDPAGNSFIENPHAPHKDPNTNTIHYTRTPTQDMSLGLQPSQQAKEDGTIEDSNPAHKNPGNYTDLEPVLEDEDGKGNSQQVKKKQMVDIDMPENSIGRQEVLKFQTNCPNCHKPADTDMCITDIPHFKEVIIMALVCEHCGYRSNEVKGGGAIPEFGTTITLDVKSSADMEREVLKSDTGGIRIPELDMELLEGGLDGLYTTVEGLMQKLHKRLTEANPFGSGDAATKQHRDNDAEGGNFSAPSPIYTKYKQFLDNLKDMADGNIFPFTLIISDPLSNSFVGPVPDDAIRLALQAEKEDNRNCYDDYVDHGMKVEEFERSHDQNEELGLNDIKTENYQKDEVDRINYGTDIAAELPDRLARADLDRRGPDHPHKVGMAPVEGDNTKMGSDSAVFATPGMQQRGLKRTKETELEVTIDSILEKLMEKEKNDGNFEKSENWAGERSKMVFKNGPLGQGYYTDVPLLSML